ncbi:MAG TPA: hypothetical protein VF267_01730 [Gammaproteobacteria bacterium]
MLQPIRRIFRRFHVAITMVLAVAWLTLGTPCLMAAPSGSHDDHDCPHCETETVVAAAACEIPADALQATDASPDLPALPAGPVALPAVPRILHPPPRPVAFHERPLWQRYCRLLE